MAKVSDAPSSQDPNQTQRATERTAGAAGSAADRTAEAARAATEAGAQATRQGAEKLQGQMDTMLGTTSRVSQEAAQRTSENLELMKRLAETMMSGAREASSEMVAWTRQASERQAEATRQITQARSMDEVLDIQNRYIRENLQALLDLSAKVSRLSADKASEASGHLDQGNR
jgi:predicted O-linked N-acetylglucosamine transferase (SPINDLY family)